MDALPIRPLRLRPPNAGDEAAAVAAHREFAEEDFSFLLSGWQPGTRWSDYLGAVERERTGAGLGRDQVPATFLFAVAGADVVGRVSIRHELNDYLAEFGGHIGYGVRPRCRGQGHATWILREALVIASDLVDGDRVLLTCDDRNLASAAVIERNGGVLEDVRDDPFEGVPKRRYWISLAA